MSSMENGHNGALNTECDEMCKPARKVCVIDMHCENQPSTPKTLSLSVCISLCLCHWIWASHFPFKINRSGKSRCPSTIDRRNIISIEHISYNNHQRYVSFKNYKRNSMTEFIDFISCCVCVTVRLGIFNRK